jgi:putative redox protein
MLEEEVGVPFPEIRLTINLTTPATDAQAQRLKSDLGKFCPVSKVIRQSGTRLEEIWDITRA